jgi:hypothetical protein
MNPQMTVRPQVWFDRHAGQWTVTCPACKAPDGVSPLEWSLGHEGLARLQSREHAEEHGVGWALTR